MGIEYLQPEEKQRLAGVLLLNLRQHPQKGSASVPLLTDDSQIGANLRVCADEENQADFDQRG